MLLVMYSGELEVQAKRKAVAVLQDEINRILNAGRSLSQLPELIVKKDKAGIKDAMEQITSLEEEVESLRRNITFFRSFFTSDTSAKLFNGYASLYCFMKLHATS